MLRAIAMALGLSLCWLVLAQPQNSVWNWAAMGGAVLACMAGAWRLGGVSDTYVRAPRLLLAYAQRSAESLRGALSIVRAASGGSFGCAPTLVRLRTQPENAGRRASLISLLNATPGLIVVDADEGGVLLHAFDEGAVSASASARRERSLRGIP